MQVNGQDVTRDGYDGVVAKMNAMPNDAHLLVADAETYEHLKQTDQQQQQQQQQHPAASETTQIYVEVIACPDEPIQTGTESENVAHTRLPSVEGAGADPGPWQSACR